MKAIYQKRDIINKFYHLIDDKHFIRVFSVIPLILLLTLIVYLLICPIADGYELSFYNSFNNVFWVVFICIYLFGISFVLREIVGKNKTKYWIISFISILIANFIFMVLPILRGYYFIGSSDADIFTHIGWIKDVAASSHIPQNNFYPVFHIIVYYIANLLHKDYTIVMNIMPAIFWSLYPIFIYVLSRLISKNYLQSMLITLFSFPLIYSIFQITPLPSFLSLIFLPLLFYIYHKKEQMVKESKFTILILFISFFLLFFHPITSLITILIFSMFIILDIILFKKHGSQAITITIVMFFSWFCWYTTYGWGTNAIYSIYKNLVYGSDFTIVSHYSNSVSIGNPTLFQTIYLFIIRYGPLALYGLISIGLLLILFWRKIIQRKTISNLEVMYGCQIILTGIISASMMFANLIVSDLIRSFMFFIMTATIFNGLVIYDILKKNNTQESELPKVYNKRHIILLKKNNTQESELLKVYNKRNIIQTHIKKILFFVLILSLFSTTILCIFNVYPDPINYQPNSQFTYKEFKGSSWVITHRNTSIQVSTTYGFNLIRMEHYINGIERGTLNSKSQSTTLISHFGYDKQNNLSLIFDNKTSYLIITKNGIEAYKAFPENIQPRAVKYSKENFEKLDGDKDVIKIYDNSEFESRLFIYKK